MAADQLACAIAAQNRTNLRAAQPVPTVAIIGDSIAASDWNGADRVTPSAPADRLKGANGILAWALALSG